MYNKIFTKILDSSIWMEPLATRIVWLTFIAAMDEQGFVEFASPANVAHRAIVPLKDTIKALKALEGPDENSSDPDHEGRRLEKVPGGWVVLNAAKYRALVTRAVKQERTRERVRVYRAKKATCNADVTQANASVTQSEAVTGARSEAEARERCADEFDIGSPSSAEPGKPVSDSDHWQMHERNQPWAKSLKAASCKIGRENWTAWKSLADEFSLPAVLSAAKGVPATERWPDRVETTLRASRGQENPGDVVASKIQRITL
jgi:hypothetical protein